VLLLSTSIWARTTTRIRVGRYPSFVSVNSATNFIYVSNESGTVTVIDGATNTVTASISVGGFAQGIAVNPASNQIYVALFAGLSSTVSVIDGNTNTVVDSIPVPGATYLAVDNLTDRIYVSDSDSTVRVIDGSSNTVIATVTMPNSVSQLAVDVTRNLIYVAVESSPPSVAVIDGSTNTVVNTFPVKGAPYLLGLAVDPSLNQVYAVYGQIVDVLDGATGNVMANIQLPGSANATYAALGAHHQVLVSDVSGIGHVFILSGNTLALIATLDLWYYPWGASVNYSTGNIYIPHSTSNFVTAIAP